MFLPLPWAARSPYAPTCCAKRGWSIVGAAAYVRTRAVTGRCASWACGSPLCRRQRSQCESIDLAGRIISCCAKSSAFACITLLAPPIRGRHSHGRSGHFMQAAGLARHCRRRLLLSGAKTELWKLTAFATFPALGWAGAVGMVAIADRLVRRLPPCRRTIGFADLVWATPLALYNTAYATIAAPLTRSIDWRGITYDIEDADQIRMRAFQPYRAAAANETQRLRCCDRGSFQSALASIAAMSSSR